MIQDNNPLVTVVIATYRRKFFLSKTIDSVLTQTYSHLEVIVVNDDKKDSLQDFIASFKDPRLYLFEIEHSGRPAVPRNVGITRASGKFIAFCDDDDIWLPDKIEEQLKAFKLYPEIKLCCADTSLIDEVDHEISIENRDEQRKIPDFRSHLIKSSIVFSTIMVCRTVFLEGLRFDERPILKASEDYLFLSHLLYLYPVFFIPKPLVKYRVHLNGISYCQHNPKKLLYYYIRILICLYDLFKKRRISFFCFSSLAKTHFVKVMKQILFPYYSKTQQYWRKSV